MGFTTYSSRLADQEILEPSEEVRLQLVLSLEQMIEKAGPAFGPGVDEMALILIRVLQDPYPEVKKVELLSRIARTDAIFKCTTASMQASAVRTMGLKALQCANLVDASGLEESVVVEALENLMLDKAPAVREVLYNVTFVWLSSLTDRYSLGYKILPFLFSGLTDEVERLRNSSEKYLNDLGILYEEEWESRVKDEVDLTIGIGNVNLLQGRPRVGCRHLARDNTQKIVKKLTEGLQNWSPDKRLKSAAILEAFITYTEENITGYTGTILPALYKILSSDEPAIMKQVALLGEAMGRFVDPDLFIGLLLNHIKSNSETLSFKLGCIRTLRSLVAGTPAAKLRTQLCILCEALTDSDFSGVENMAMLKEIASLAEVLARKFREMYTDADRDTTDLANDGYRLFVLMLSLAGVQGSEKVQGWLELKQAVESTAEFLRGAHGDASYDDLYKLYFMRLFSDLSGTLQTWTRSSSEARVMRTLLSSSGKLVGEYVTEVIPVVSFLCNEDRDIELRLSIYPELLKRLDDSSDNIRIHACEVLGVFTELIARFHSKYKDLPDRAHGYMDGTNYVETRLDDVHWVTMVKGICIHVDDVNSEVSTAAAQCLERVCRVAPRNVVQEQLETLKSRFRNAAALDKILCI
ncbi:HEAT repeat-containing protein 2 [Phlyctochytrium bullatum]|nr:HEAT repeat-containing protein 2 [Phlyctochytrium bullatum]